MKDIIGNLADIMKEKFPRRKTLSILNLLDTPAEAQQLLDWYETTGHRGTRGTRYIEENTRNTKELNHIFKKIK